MGKTVYCHYLHTSNWKLGILRELTRVMRDSLMPVRFCLRDILMHSARVLPFN